MELTHTAEEKFIIDCLASELSGGGGTITASEKLDWARVGNLLEEHRLAGYFCVFGQAHPGVFPAALRSELKKTRYGLLIYGDIAREQVRKVLEALVATGIPVIVMKGWALITTLYGGDHGQRFCEDIDILVNPEHTDQAEVILQGLGYSGVDEVMPGYSRRFTNARAYTLPGDPLAGMRKFAIGLHWGLTHYPYFDEKRINISEIFSRAYPLQAAGVEALQMCPEDQIVYTCAHLSLHHRNQENLMNYFEIATLLQKGKEGIDVSALIARAREWGYLVQVQNTLRQLDSLWPDVIAPNVLQQILSEKSPWVERKIDALVAKTKGNRFRSALVEFLAGPGLGNKFSASLHQLFPGRAYMQVRYGTTQNESLLQLYLNRISGAVRGIFSH